MNTPLLLSFLIMRRLERHRHFLQDVLSQANKHQRQAQLQAANSDQINALRELSLNLLKRHIPVHPATVKKLHPHRHTLRSLARRHTSVKKRREILLKQKGGGIWLGLRDVLHSIL